jgi:hypothetical protein
MTIVEFIVSLFRRRHGEHAMGDATAAAEVMASHAESLMRMRGVMSVSVGRTPEGEPAIVVGLDDPRADSVADIPTSLDGVPVIHHRIGQSGALEGD